MVDRVRCYYITLFKGSSGFTQVNPLSLTILNMVLDMVIQHWEIVVAGEDSGP